MTRLAPHTKPPYLLRSARNHGFTLLEMSIVLGVIAGIIVGTLSMGSSMVASAQKVSTENKLDAIETALMAYRKANDRLPCPTDPTITDIPAHSTTYGYETGNPGDCTTGYVTPVTYTIPVPTGASTTRVASSTTVVEGAIPVKTLGLPDEFQFDGWGRKFAYAVWAPITAKASVTNAPNGNGRPGF